jgi:hypothetical protein
MNDIPNAIQLLAIARATLLDKLFTQLPEELRYEALMIANAMAIAIREQANGETAARGELARLRALFVDPEQPLASAAPEAALSDYRRRLATDIRNGRFDGAAREALLAHLAQTAAEAVAISNPKALDRP